MLTINMLAMSVVLLVMLVGLSRLLFRGASSRPAESAPHRTRAH